jgi:hypothetical protein
MDRPKSLPMKTAITYSRALDAIDRKQPQKARSLLKKTIQQAPDFGLAQSDLVGLLNSHTDEASVETSVSGGAVRGLIVEGRGSAPQAPKSFAELYETSRAVVIGINEFEKPWPRLKGAEHDARAVAKLLRETGFTDVVEIYGKAATRDRIWAELYALRDRVEEEDRLIFYFAGHGQTVRSGDKSVGYLIPSDRAVAKKGISMRALQTALDELPARHVMFIADACYSGLGLHAFRSGDDGVPDHYMTRAKKRARVALSAGDDNQKVIDNYKDGHGLFTYFLLQGLEGEADNNSDGVMTSNELMSFVESRVSAESGGAQTPMKGESFDGGWFLFEAPKAR